VNKKEVKEESIKEVTVNVQDTRLGRLEYINEIWNKIKRE
jgi:hypothetical protein